jgi:hypothetical protein
MFFFSSEVRRIRIHGIIFTFICVPEHPEFPFIHGQKRLIRKNSNIELRHLKNGGGGELNSFYCLVVDTKMSK